LFIDCRQSALDPAPHRILVNVEKPRGLIHRVAAMDFDAPRIDALHRWPAVSMRKFEEHPLLLLPTF
jgi:hypothetical protein